MQQTLDGAVPLVSVALCTYNGTRFLAGQLESLLGQDYPAFEIVAVDDASSDDTLAILENFRRRDSRLRVHRNSVNLGLNRNFERAFGLCRGDLIAPCDQDDIWLPQKLSALVERIRGAQLAYCDSELVDERGKPLGHRVSDRVTMYSGEDPAVFALYNCVSGHAALFRRGVLEHARPFPEERYYDWWLAFVAASLGRVEFVDRCLVQFRRHSLSTSGFAGIDPQARLLSAKPGPWFDRLRRIESPRRSLLTEMHRLSQARSRQVVSFRLPLLLYRHRHALFRLRRGGEWRNARRVMRYFWGRRYRKIGRQAPSFRI